MVSARTELKRRARGRTPRITSPPSAHAEELGDRSEEQLAALLALRPDLAVPAPATLHDVEVRALSNRSVLRALTRADASVLQLVQIFTLLGDKHARVADVRAMAGEGTEPALDQALDWLARHHLVAAVSEDEVCVHPSLLTVADAAALGPPASELVERLSVPDLQSVLAAIGREPGASRKAALVGQLVAFLADAAAVSDVVAHAPPDARAMAGNLATRSASLTLPWDVASAPYGARKAPGAAAAWLLQHGLVYRDSWVTAVMPREVGLALRGGRPFPPGSYRRPAVELEPLCEPGAATVEARAVAVTQAVERMVESWGARPAPVLKSGGVGVREVRRLAADVELPERDTFRLVEIAAAAGLVVEDARREVVLPAAAADEWLDLGVAHRWWALAHSWLEMPSHPSLAGVVDARGKPLPALAYGPETSTRVPAQRLGLLRVALEARHARGDAEASLAGVASWEAPLAWSDVGAAPPVLARWMLSEMELLGLAVNGAPTVLARALVEDDAVGACRFLADRDADAWELVLQADLTALVTGRAPSRVRAELTLLADVEGRGSATVYRFSEASVRRGFDAGRTAEEISGFLAAHAHKGVPQALAYLVGDVGRRHGHMRVGRATCYVRFDDVALATEVLRSRKTAKLGLRPISPTVLASDHAQQGVLDVLRGCGYLPVEESGDGEVVRTAVVRERAQPGRSPGAPPHDHDHELPADRWGLRAGGGGTEAGAGPDRWRVLAAGLLGPAGASRRAARGRPGAVETVAAPRVEIPTLLRRPGNGVLDGAVLGPFGDELDGEDLPDDVAVELHDDFDGEDFEGEDFEGEDADARGHAARPARPERPSEIVRSDDAVLAVLQLAAEEGWLVRISYTSGSGKTFEVTVDVLDVSDRTMLALVAPRWTEQTYVLERIGWVRVLNEAEEELVR